MVLPDPLLDQIAEVIAERRGVSASDVVETMRQHLDDINFWDEFVGPMLDDIERSIYPE